MKQLTHIKTKNKYFIENDGTLFVKNRFGFKKMAYSISNSGYPSIKLFIGMKYGKRKYKNEYIHRLVAQYFIPNHLNYPEINHKNGNKLNNNVENLEWCTPSQNKLHKFRILGYRNKPQSFSPYKVDDIERILALRRRGLLHREIAEIMNIGIQTSIRVCNGNRWGNVTGIKYETKN